MRRLSIFVVLLALLVTGTAFADQMGIGEELDAEEKVSTEELDAEEQAEEAEEVEEVEEAEDNGDADEKDDAQEDGKEDKMTPAQHPINKGKIHLFGSLGYALPVIILENTGGAMPIRIGAHYFPHRNVGLGMKMVFNPIFGADAGTFFVLNAQPEIYFMTNFGLGFFVSLGLTTASANIASIAGSNATTRDTEALFGMGTGVSYNLFLNQKVGLEFGFEFDFNFQRDVELIYPLFFIGVKFASGQTKL